MDLIKRAGELLTKNSSLYDPDWLLANFGAPERMSTFEKWRNYIKELENRKRNGKTPNLHLS